MNPTSPAAGLLALCQVLMERSPLPMAELEGEAHVVRYANPAFCRLAGKPQQALVGRPFAETMQEGDSCLAVLERVYRTGEAEFHTESGHPDPHPAYWSYAIWPLPDETGRTAGLAMQVTETTKSRPDASEMTEALLISSVHLHESAEAAEKMNDLLRTEIGNRRRAEEQVQRAFAAVMTNMSEGLYTTDRQGRVTVMNPTAETLFGWRFEELRGRDVITHSHGDGVPRLVGEDAAFRVIETGEPLTDREDFFIRKDGSVFPVLYSAVPLREGEDTVGLVVVFRDVTERKRAEEHERALANEFAHRNRNLLAVIQVIVARSLTNERSAAENRKALLERLRALARSQKVLESKGYEGASLAEIIRLELDAFAGRYQAAGPDVALNAKATQTFALLIHELATNATKHGALSSPDGSVGVDWAIDSGGAEPRFRFRWQERGGPPVVRPTRQGFGRVLIEKIAAQDFGGRPRVDYEPEGLTYEIEAPLLAVVAANPQESGQAGP